MKFFAVLLALAASAIAQSINIGSPAVGSTIPTGDVTVQVIRPDFQSQAQEVAIVISIDSCREDGTCNDPAQGLGSILYNGPFNPQRTSNPRDQPQQNFTVSIPDFIEGKALLSVLHLTLIGAGATPFLEYVNATVNVQ